MMDFTKGNYTAYMVPHVQVEGSGMAMHDNIEELKRKTYGAIEIFETPGESGVSLAEAFGRNDAEQGVFCKWLREKYKSVWKDGEFHFDHKKPFKIGNVVYE